MPGDIKEYSTHSPVPIPRQESRYWLYFIIDLFVHLSLVEDRMGLVCVVVFEDEKEFGIFMLISPFSTIKVNYCYPFSWLLRSKRNTAHLFIVFED